MCQVLFRRLENCGKSLRHNISPTDQPHTWLTVCWLQYNTAPYFIIWEYKNTIILIRTFTVTTTYHLYSSPHLPRLLVGVEGFLKHNEDILFTLDNMKRDKTLFTEVHVKNSELWIRHFLRCDKNSHNTDIDFFFKQTHCEWQQD